MAKSYAGGSEIDFGGDAASIWRVGGWLPLASFQVKGYESQEVTSILDSTFSVAVRGGLHCAPLVHESLGTSPEGAVRVSGSALSTSEDLEGFLAALDSIAG